MLIDQYAGPRGTRIHTLYHNVLPRVVDVLYEEGYKIQSPEGLKQKHIVVLSNALIDQALPPPTLDMVWLAVKGWAKWVGKHDLVDFIENLAKRQTLSPESSLCE
jgi:hypothetical protein